ncbi:MAG: phosphonoacetaldehyde hydrolase [Planctomycetota bacterium]|nr:phosphonoacetaldehyde hydrolase [Planctomycetota bacterium]MDA1213117.1 phosphonoacetaldehyde hydrolase [Planctomycetota bacterium]
MTGTSSTSRGPIRLAIFDLGGTAIDFGCLAPVVAFVEAFKQSGMDLTIEQARGPMGLGKLDHIRELFRLPELTQQWETLHQRPWTEDDVRSLYNTFVPMQGAIALKFTDFIPGILEGIAAFRQQGLAIATTTGYPRAVADPILDVVARNGFRPDVSYCADDLPAGRPEPWMIFRCMEQLRVFPPHAVVNIGDTVPDMEAARNAGVWAIGVTESGSEFGLSQVELAKLSSQERDERHHAATKKLTAAGAHLVIRSLSELPGVLGRLPL